MWLGDGTLAKVTPDLYEILLDDGQWLYVDTIVFSGVSATAYWNRGYNGIGTKDIPYDQIVSITRGDAKVFPQEGDIEMVERRVLTRGKGTSFQGTCQAPGRKGHLCHVRRQEGSWFLAVPRWRGNGKTDVGSF
jgi:hypothetical protein